MNMGVIGVINDLNNDYQRLTREIEGLDAQADRLRKQRKDVLTNLQGYIERMHTEIGIDWLFRASS